MIKCSIPIEEMIKDSADVVFFGIGRFLEGILANPYCRKLGLFSKVSYLIDNNERLWGQDSPYDELFCKICAPGILTSLKRCHVVITSRNYSSEISDQLEEIDCQGDYCIWDEIYDLYCENKKLPEIINKNSIKEPVIPKVIHYCWFGDKELPSKEKECIKGWNELCPDYEIVFWNETNFDIYNNKYVKEAYESKKYAFVTDYFRLWVIYNYGGIYLDADVELIKKPDCFLVHDFFSGFESRNYIPTGIMGGKKGSRYAEYLLGYYTYRAFIVDDKPDLTTNVATISNMTRQKYGVDLCNGYLDLEDCTMYPQEVFCPIVWSSGIMNITPNTYAIHWFSGTWG